MPRHPRVAELIALGAMALGISAGTAFTEEDPAYVLHVGLENTNTLESFDRAKEHIYTDIDRDDATVTCVYSGTAATMTESNGEFRPPTTVGFQVEHTWASKASWMEPEDRFERDSVPGADLHHLFPARQGLNGSRGNLAFGVPVSSVRELLLDPDGTLHQPSEGAGGIPSFCSRGVDAHGATVFMPREEHRGDLARSIFYMSVRYWWEIPDEMELVLRDWHEADAVNDGERARNDRVESIQHNRNPFIDEPTLVGEIIDF